MTNPVEYNTFRRLEGKYNWADPSEVQAEYLFDFREGAPKLTRSFVVPLNGDEHYEGPDQISPYELALWLEGIFKGYLFSSSLVKIREVAAYLDSWQQQDVLDYTRQQIARKKGELLRLEEQVAGLERELAEMEAQSAD